MSVIGLQDWQLPVSVSCQWHWPVVPTEIAHQLYHPHWAKHKSSLWRLLHCDKTAGLCQSKMPDRPCQPQVHGGASGAKLKLFHSLPMTLTGWHSKTVEQSWPSWSPCLQNEQRFYAPCLDKKNVSLMISWVAITFQLAVKLQGFAVFNCTPEFSKAFFKKCLCQVVTVV